MHVPKIKVLTYYRPLTTLRTVRGNEGPDVWPTVTDVDTEFVGPSVVNGFPTEGAARAYARHVTDHQSVERSVILTDDVMIHTYAGPSVIEALSARTS